MNLSPGTPVTYATPNGPIYATVVRVYRFDHVMQPHEYLPSERWWTGDYPAPAASYVIRVSDAFLQSLVAPASALVTR
jgi:hypothetical protein